MRAQLSRDTEAASAPSAVESSEPETRSNVPGFGAQGGGARPNLMEASQSAVTQATSGGGSPLPASVRAPMERSFGTDFGGVRVHEGPSADSMGGARAATRGSHIAFAPGQFDPGSRGGRELIGHELAHVTQQQQGRVQPMAQGKGGNLSTDPGLEAEADRAGALAAAGQPARLSGPSARGGGGGATEGPTQFDLTDKLKNAWKDSNLNPKHRKQKSDRRKAVNKIAIEDVRTDGTTVARIATEAVDAMRGGLKGVLAKQLDKHFGDAIEQAGIDKVKQDLNVQGDRKKLDMLPHAKEIFEKSGAREKAIATKAEAMAKHELDAIVGPVTAATDKAFTDYEVQAEKQAGKAVEVAKAEVESTIKKFVKDKYDEIVTRLKTAIETDAKNNQSAYKAELTNATTNHADLATEMQKESDKRDQKDPIVLLAVADAWKHGKDELDKKLYVFLKGKLGVGGVGGLRSEKLKAFRQTMLDHGREKAKEQAKTQMDLKLGQTVDDQARKDAELRALEKSDAATDLGLKEIAKEGRDHAITASDAKNKLEAVASKAAYAVIRANDQKRGKAAALTAVKKELPNVEKDAIEKARIWKNALVKQNDQQRLTDAKTKIEESQTAQKTGESSANEAHGNIAPVDTLVGDVNSGDGKIEKGRFVFGVGMGEYLAHEIGARGAGFTRGKKVRELRKKLKLVARKKAYGDVDTELGKTGQGERFEHTRKAKLKYMKVSGKDQAYDIAKGSVNAEMIALCRDGTKKMARTRGLQAKLVAVARETGFTGLREKKSDLVIKREIVKAIEDKASLELEDAKKVEAVAWLNTIFQDQEQTDIDDGGPPPQGGQAPPLTKVKDRIEKRVGDDKVGEKAVNAAIDANNLGKGMTALARLCDVAVPNRGDAAKLEVEVRIPVPTAPGVYIVVKVGGEAERGVTTRKNENRENSKGKKDGGDLDSRSLKIGANIGIGAGFEAVGVRGDGSFNMFARAQGMDSDKAFQMLAYGFYRAVSKISDKMADALWGGSGKSKDQTQGGHGKGATERAELWAAMVEETAMTRRNPFYDPALWVAKKNQANPNPLKTLQDAPPIPPGERITPVTTHEKKLAAKGPYINDEEAFVEIGAGIQGRVKAKGPVVEGEGSLKIEAFKRYDAPGMKRKLKKYNLQNVGNEVKLGDGGDNLGKAQQRRKAMKGKVGVGAVGEAKIAFDVGGVKFELSGKIEFSNTSGFALEIGAGIKFDTTKDGGPSDIEKWVSGFTGSAASVVRTLIGAVQNRKDKPEEQFGKHMGELLDVGNDVENMIDTASGGQLTTALGESWKMAKTPSDMTLGSTPSPDKPDDLLKQAISGETMLQVVLNIAPPHTVAFSIKQVKTRKLNLTVGTGVGVDVSLEKSKRLMQFGYVRKKWHVEGLGFGTTNERM